MSSRSVVAAALQLAMLAAAHPAAAAPPGPRTLSIVAADRQRSDLAEDPR